MELEHFGNPDGALATISGWQSCLRSICQSKCDEFCSQRNAKEHWRPAYGGKTDLSEKTDRFID